MDILVLLRVILRRWWIWTTVPLIAGAAAFYFSRQLPDVYKSTAQLSSGLLAEDQVRINDQQKAVNFREVDIKFSNILQNLKSKNVISLVSYRLIIRDLTSNNPYRKIDKKSIERPDILNQDFLRDAVSEFRSRLDSMKILSVYDEKEKKLNDLLKIYSYDYDGLLENFAINRIGFTDYISIEFFADNPFLCAEAVNILSEEFMRYHNSLRSQFSGESVEFFERMAEEKKREMDEKSRLLSMFKSSNSVLNFEAESQSKVLQIEQLENIRSDEHRRISSINLSLANVNQRLESLNSGSGSESGTPKLSDYANKIAEMNQRYISTGQSNTQLADSLVVLRREYTLERGRVSGMTAGAGSKREQIQKLEEDKNRLEVELQIAQSAILDLDLRIRGLRSNASSFASKESRIGELQRELDIATTEYLTFQNKLNDARNTAMVMGNAVKQTIKGQPSEAPLPSKKIIYVFAAMATSFFLCVGTITFLELIDFKLKTPEKFKQVTKLPFCGSVNLLNVKQIDFFKVFREKSKNKEIEMFKESIRKIRYEIEASGKRRILITSTKEKEGKTFITLALALSLSLINKRVLIVDTNFKNNSLSKYLLPKSPEEKYLALNGNNDTYLLSRKAGEKNEPDPQTTKDYNIISSTAHKFIDLVACKNSDESPSEIFAAKNFNALLDDLSYQYDYILMEGAALNKYSDTKELVDYVEGVLPVFSADSTINASDRESIEYFKSLDGKIVGAILNEVEIKNLS